MKIIEFDNIYKKRLDSEILKGISFSVEKGQIFGLLGPSGAGKTTILNILTGQLMSTSGYSSIMGVKSEAITKTDARKIGIMLDQCSLYDRLSCYDNLAFFCELLKLDKNKIPNVLEKVGLKEFSQRPVKILSKGMKQRLLFARAIIHDPEIVFLDEPTGSLDPTTTSLIHDIILNMKGNGTTFFITTHNMEEAAKICDVVALLHKGVIVAKGSPDEICSSNDSHKVIEIVTEGNKKYKIPYTEDYADIVYSYMKKYKVRSINFSNVDLETVFINLTGMELDDVFFNNHSNSEETV